MYKQRNIEFLSSRFNHVDPTKSPIKIYNFTSGNKVPLTWGEIYGIAERHLFQNPLEGMVWYPEGSFKRSVKINRYIMKSMEEY